MNVKLYDAHNGVEKIIKNVVALTLYNGKIIKNVVVLTLYNGKIIVTDNKDAEFYIPQHEFEHYCIFAYDELEEKQ